MNLSMFFTIMWIGFFLSVIYKFASEGLKLQNRIEDAESKLRIMEMQKIKEMIDNE